MQMSLSKIKAPTVGSHLVLCWVGRRCWVVQGCWRKVAMQASKQTSRTTSISLILRILRSLCFRYASEPGYSPCRVYLYTVFRTLPRSCCSILSPVQSRLSIVVMPYLPWGMNLHIPGNFFIRDPWGAKPG